MFNLVTNFEYFKYFVVDEYVTINCHLIIVMYVSLSCYSANGFFKHFVTDSDACNIKQLIS